MKKRVLLVEPDFPYPNRSKNRANDIHKNFVPIGLLKLGSLNKAKGNSVKLVRGKVKKEEIGFIPDEILITSMFTYWSNYVWGCVEHYRNLFPKKNIWIGGIYVTLHHNQEKFKDLTKRNKVKFFVGVHNEAENFLPDYSLIPPVEYHATHIMRGCIRKCDFCGVWKLEPKLSFKTLEQLKKELDGVGKNNVIFFDNNFFANPKIKDILKNLAEIRINGKPVTFESQSGFDGRLLEKDPELAILLKKARFNNVRIAWDNSVKDKKSIKKQIDLLKSAEYPLKDISIFMIYNFDVPYEEMIKKLNLCKKWGVQIIDCRYRPLDLDYDNYSPHMRKGQPEGSFYIHKKAGWTDKKIRDFRRKVRQQNMEIRYANGGKYDKNMEKWSAIHNTYKFFKLGPPPLLEKIDKSDKLKKRILMLNKLKNDYKKKGIGKKDLSKLSKKELDEFIG